MQREKVRGDLMKKIPIYGGHYAIVDDEDYEHLIGRTWSYNLGYAVRREPMIDGQRKNILMHRVVVDAPDGMEVDHINMDRLDNRECNLRIATRAENIANRPKRKGSYSSNYKGVSWSKSHKCWLSGIYKERKYHHIGYFKDEAEAAMEYNKAALKLYGEFARLNETP